MHGVIVAGMVVHSGSVHRHLDHGHGGVGIGVGAGAGVQASL
ncbi:MAG: Uncharacterised protein [Synechococcus sp. MIT S9220]|nr:MAG: Uncharacterised protein [Synechococcus sp. MIT S9220]